MIKIAKTQKFKTGDIIAFFNDDHKLFAHRYVKIFGTARTRGDNNQFFDPFIIKNPLGRVLVDERPIRRAKIIFKLKFQLLYEMLRGAF